MQVKGIAALQYFRPSLSYNLPLRPMFKSIFEWPLKTGFTVYATKVMDGRPEFASTGKA